MGAIWFVAGYALVSLSMTKFHHYILPAIPGLAIVDRLLPRRHRAPRRDGRAAAAAALVGIPLLALVAIDLVDTQERAQRFLWLFSYDYIHSPSGRPWPAGLDFSGAADRRSASSFALATLALGWSRASGAGRRSGCRLAAVAFTFFLLDGYMRGVDAVLVAEGADRDLLQEARARPTSG